MKFEKVIINDAIEFDVEDIKVYSDPMSIPYKDKLIVEFGSIEDINLNNLNYFYKLFERLYDIFLIEENIYSFYVLEGGFIPALFISTLNEITPFDNDLFVSLMKSKTLTSYLYFNLFYLYFINDGDKKNKKKIKNTTKEGYKIARTSFDVVKKHGLKYGSNYAINLFKYKKHSKSERGRILISLDKDEREQLKYFSKKCNSYELKFPYNTKFKPQVRN